MTPVPPDAVRRLSAAELAPVVDELVRRYSDGDLPRTIALRQLPDPSLRAVADLLALDRVPRQGSRLQISRIAAALGLPNDTELRAAVEQVRGPLSDRRAARRAEAVARAELWDWLEDVSGAARIGDLSSWVAAVRSAGVRGGVVAHRQKLAAALQVLYALPADGVPLAALASDCTGDPHALDAGRPLASSVLDAIAAATGAAPATGAESARALWESVGVVPDPLSSAVLALGLDGDDTPLGCSLAAMATAGEPAVLTYAMLRRWPRPPLPPEVSAYVVENPTLIADAVARGWSGPPLICSSGRPTMAVVALIRQLAADGATVRQHADFDPAGLAITQWLAERAGTTPWRMTCADYTRAMEVVRARVPLQAPLPATPWDPSLRDEMLTHGAVVYEEAVRVELLAAARLESHQH